MRVVIANAFGHLVGGTETYVRDLIPALRSRGHETALLHEVEIGSATPLHDPATITSWCARTLGATASVAAVVRWRPDVMVVNRLLDSRLERRLIAVTPSILFAHDYRGMCATGQKTLMFPSASACTRSIGLGCLALNYARRCGARNPVALLRDYRLQLRRRALFAEYRTVVVASAHMRDELMRNSVPPDRIVVNPLWPTIEPEPVAPSRRSTNGSIAFLGRLAKAKGPAIAAEAVAIAARHLGRTLVLRVGGEGPELARLARIGESGGSVQLLGWVEGVRRRALLADADLLVVPSLWPEPFGLVGLEAACLGTPAAAFDIGGVREWLVPGQSGELARPGSVEALANAIVRCLKDADRHHTLRVNAWRHARRFTADRHVGVLEAVLREAWPAPRHA